MVSRRLLISVGAALMLTAAMRRAMVVVNCILKVVENDLFGCIRVVVSVNDIAVMETR